LAKNPLAAPLFTKNLGTAYSKMYGSHQADIQPDHIVFSWKNCRWLLAEYSHFWSKTIFHLVAMVFRLIEKPYGL